jgi:hypothetical protein
MLLDKDELYRGNFVACTKYIGGGNTLAPQAPSFSNMGSTHHKSEDPTLFIDIPIDPAILAEEQTFWVKRNSLSQIAIRGASEELKEADWE